MNNVIITGATDGIGFEIVEELLKNNFRVLVLDKKKK